MAARTKKAPEPTADIVTAGGFEPVRITTKTKAADPGVVLFYIDDIPYSIPSRVPQSIVLEFLRLSRTDGEMIAGQRLLERLLGADAYMAMEQSDQIDDDALEQIMTAAIHHIAGVGESGK
jgi:hypothetical protein